MVQIISISLRTEEVAAIETFLKEHPQFKTRHELIKHVLRQFFIPNELEEARIRFEILQKAAEEAKV